MPDANKNVTLTKARLDRMYIMWHKTHEEPPKNSEDWVTYLISIQTNSLKSKRSFPDVMDINSVQLNRFFFWLVRSALINNDQKEMKKAFAFCTQLRKARADQRTETMNASIKKVTTLQKLVADQRSE